jgi:hypothetical protein
MNKSTMKAIGAPVGCLVLLGCFSIARSEPVLPSAPDWIGDNLELVARLGFDPVADLETRGNYHWRWRATRTLSVDKYQCPGGTTLDVSRTIVVVMAPPGETCSSSGRAATTLKVERNGSAAPMSE